MDFLFGMWGGRPRFVLVRAPLLDHLLLKHATIIACACVGKGQGRERTKGARHGYGQVSNRVVDGGPSRESGGQTGHRQRQVGCYFACVTVFLSLGVVSLGLRTTYCRSLYTGSWKWRCYQITNLTKWALHLPTWLLRSQVSVMPQIHLHFHLIIILHILNWGFACRQGAEGERGRGEIMVDFNHRRGLSRQALLWFLNSWDSPSPTCMSCMSRPCLLLQHRLARGAA